MTSQIVIMNQRGFAFASDSAVITGQYSSNSVQKIFSLPGRQPIAFMIMGSAIHAPSGLSWERVIYQYHLYFIKKYGKDGELLTMNDYEVDFTSYLNSIISTEINAHSLMGDLYTFFGSESSYIWRGVSEDHEVPEFSEAPTSPQSVFTSNITSTLDFFKGKASGDVEKVYQVGQVLNTYKEELGAVSTAIIESTQYIKEPTQKVKDTMSEFLAQHLVFYQGDDGWKQSTSTVIMAGFGSKDDYPSYVKLKTATVTLGLQADLVVSRATIQPNAEITPSNLDQNKVSSSRVFIEPLALDRFTSRLTTGMDKKYWNKKEISREADISVKEWLEEFGAKEISKVSGIGDVTAKKVVKHLIDDAEMPSAVGYRHWWAVRRELQESKKSFREAVDRLAPIDLCKMAKHLIETEAIMSSFIYHTRSVDLPIDSCYVTKENGFVWSSIKNIPDPTINPKVFNIERDGSLMF